MSERSVRGGSQGETEWIGWYPLGMDRDPMICLANEEIASELEWVYAQLARSCSHPIITLRPARRDGEGFVEGVASQAARLGFVPPFPPKRIYVTSSQRTDPIEQVVNELVQRFPTTVLRLVLGEWWVGQRRTWPLPATCSAIYWYQCHDVLLAEWSEREGGNDEVVHPQLRPGLVIAAGSDSRQMWLEVLPSIGFSSLAMADLQTLPEGRVDLVLLDADADVSLDRLTACGTHESARGIDFEPIAGKIRKLKQAYPRAVLVVVSSFPRWEEVRLAIASGADWILAKPFQLNGLRALLAQSEP